jgi:lipoyl(octanoyl) transferase
VGKVSLPPAALVDIGLTDYAAAYAVQQRLVAKRREGSAADDMFLLTEHRPVFTLGKRGGRESLMVSEQFLAARGVGLIQIERGGLITYHGPGQLVLYPLFHLHQAGVAIHDYVFRLEEVMLLLARHFGVGARRDERNHGIWVGNNKLGSIGIAVRHGVTFHGLAMNVDVDPEPFSWVNPCGLTGVSMTSLSLESGRKIPLPSVKKHLADVLSAVFDRRFQVQTKTIKNIM